MSRRSTNPLELEIRALSDRQRALEAAVGTGASAESWATCQNAYATLEAALQINPPTRASLIDINTAMATLRAHLRDGAGATALWKEIRTNAETLRRLVDTNRRRTSPEDRLADREADRQRRLAQAIEETGIGSAPPAGTPRRRPRRP